MNQTFRDFAYECKMYPYSKEAYELLKECSELTLMEKFIENQQFIESQQEYLTSNSITLTESYYQEASAKDTIKDIGSQAKSKSKNIWNKIRTGLKKLFARIRAFFEKILSKMKDDNKKAEDILKKLRKLTITNSDIDSISELYQDICKSAPGKYAEVANAWKQPFASKLKLKYASDVRDSSKSSLEQKISFSLSTSTVRLNAEEDNVAIHAEDLVSACKKLIDARRNYQADQVKSMIEGAQKDVRKNGLIINTDIKKIESLITKLQELEKSVDNMRASEVEVQEDSESRDSDTENAHLIDHINYVYGMINLCIGDTITVYSQYAYIRKHMIAAISGWLKSNANNKAED